jgi:hypothetical protein
MEKKYPKPFRTLFLVHSLMMAGFAGIYLLIPVQWGDLTGCLSNQVPQVFRMFGTSILGMAVLSFLSYRAATWQEVKIAAWTNCIMPILSSLVILAGLLFWSLPSIAWIYLVLMIAFAAAFNAATFQR